MTEVQLLMVIAAASAIQALIAVFPLLRVLNNWKDRQLRHYRSWRAEKTKVH